jgi:HJR/Mrr/RecB family endonuclease
MFFNKKKIELQNQEKIARIEEEKQKKLQEEIRRSQIYSDYKEKIDKHFLELKGDSTFLAIFENFMSQIPVSVFTNKDCYLYFEFLLKKKFEIGKDIFWSSSSDLFEINQITDKDTLNLLNIGAIVKIQSPNIQELFDLQRRLSDYEKEIQLFVEDKFTKMTRLLKNIRHYEDESEYIFVLLRLIQLTAPCFLREALPQTTGLDYSDIENISFEECMFRYYKKFTTNSNKDPMISLLTYFLLNYQKFGEVKNIDYYNYLVRRNEIIKYFSEKKEEFDYKIFETNMKKKPQIVENGYSIVDVDLMSGDEFEQFVAKLFTKMGYKTTVTPHSRDFGVDVIAERGDIKIGIQAKCYTNPVSNSAIQEIVAGMKYYGCQKGVAVSNRIFTKAAIELAQANSIQLWDRSILIDKITELL